MSSDMSEKGLIFVPIAPADFQEKMHFLFKWNIEPLSWRDFLKVGDAFHCPDCGLVRYVMWKVLVPPEMVYMGNYCTCPHKQRGDE